jgi:hypothetical protein
MPSDTSQPRMALEDPGIGVYGLHRSHVLRRRSPAGRCPAQSAWECRLGRRSRSSSIIMSASATVATRSVASCFQIDRAFNSPEQTRTSLNLLPPLGSRSQTNTRSRTTSAALRAHGALLRRWRLTRPPSSARLEMGPPALAYDGQHLERRHDPRRCASAVQALIVRAPEFTAIQIGRTLGSTVKCSPSPDPVHH